MEVVGGNRITLLQDGVEYFPALEAAFEAARHEIHLETYIFESDDTGRAIAAALERAARRGVATYVMVDGFGSQHLSQDLVREMRAAGVHFLVYRQKISPWTLKRARLRRLHRKLAVIDARTAFVGGINIIDDEDPVHGARFDYAVRVEGPLVAGIYRVVKRLWRLVAATQFRSRRAETRALAPDTAPRGNQSAAFLVRDNLKHRREIEEAYLAAIAGARSEVVIANAYFFPGRSFRRALVDAATRGVRVVLLLQGRADHLLYYYASRALYGTFLDAGVEIHEYHKSFLHAKVAVIDRNWSTVGSSNIDPFSLLLAREANVVIEDPAFANQLSASLAQAMEQGATQLKRERWANEPLPVRMAIWTCYGLTRFLTGVFAYGQAKEFV